MEALMMGVVSLAAMGVAVFFALLTLMTMQQRPVVATGTPSSKTAPLQKGLMGLVQFGWIPERLAGRMLRQAESNGYEKVWGMTAAGFIFVALVSTQLTQQLA